MINTASENSYSASVSAFPQPPSQRQDFQNSVTIVSVFPRDLVALDMKFAGIDEDGNSTANSNFILPKPDPKIGYSMIRVYDTDQLIQDSSDPLSRMKYRWAPVSRFVLAKSLVQKWAGDMTGNKSGFSIGVAIIDGLEPTKADLDQLRLHQENFFRYLVNEASDLANQHKHNEIPTLARDAAEWLGMQDLDWYKQPKRRDLKRCIGCKQDIGYDAKTCVHCHINIVRYAYDQITERFLAISELELEDPFIAAIVKRRLDEVAASVGEKLAEPAKPAPGKPLAPPVVKAS